MAETNGATDSSGGVICSLEEFLATRFDFVVCGGGTAGCAIAARLSEDPSVNVGVIEAGKNKLGDPLVDTPTAFFQMFEKEEYDWCMYTAPQKANHDKVHHMPRGKLLGGSSGINYMMYVRGSEQDYDDWAALAKDDGWSAKVMQPYMRKHQTLEPIDPGITDRSSMPFVGEHHGTSGPVRTSFNDSITDVEDAVIKACDDACNFSKRPVDPWSGEHVGFYRTLASIARTGPNKGKRSYAARGYIEANQDRPNLKVLCEALVNKVNLDGKKATSVNFSHGGKQYDVSAQREIIVSGGTIQSPQILELSGIGDPKVLEAAGVECKVENPAVGNNLQDHAATMVVFEVKPGVVTMDTLYQVPEAMQAVLKLYMETGGGPLSHIASCQGFFPFRLVASEDEVKEVVQSIRDVKPTSDFHRQQLEKVIAHLESDISANLQLVCLPSTPNVETGVQHQSVLFPPREASKPAGLSFAMCLQYPVSRGSIHIASSDPTAHPIIDPAYLSHPADAAVLAAAVRWAEKVGQSKHLSDHFDRRSIPASSVNLQDLEQGKKWVHEFVAGEYHPCGSVALGDALDARLRVKGVDGLRVADASIFPNHVSGNIVSSVYAVAEKAADLIKEDWGLKSL